MQISSPISVKASVEDIKKFIVNFFGWFTSIEVMKRSEISENDKIGLATALFKRSVGHPCEDFDRKFRLLPA